MQQLARTLVFATIALASTTSAISAQTGIADADSKEIAAYTLTMATVNKFETAMRAFATEMKKDPRVQQQMKLKNEIDALKKKEELTDAEQTRLESLEQQLEEAKDRMQGEMNIGKAETLSEMATQASRIPQLVTALKSAGLTPREYAVFTLALFQASAYAGLQKAGMVKDIPANVNRAQIKFVLDHEAEIRALTERMKEESDEQP